MADHILITFPAAKVFASGKIKICEMLVERLADEWIATSSNINLANMTSKLYDAEIIHAQKRYMTGLCETILHLIPLDGENNS